jgi:hypothetical protein
MLSRVVRTINIFVRYYLPFSMRALSGHSRANDELIRKTCSHFASFRKHTYPDVKDELVRKTCSRVASSMGLAHI